MTALVPRQATMPDGECDFIGASSEAYYLGDKRKMIRGFGHVTRFSINKQGGGHLHEHGS